MRVIFKKPYKNHHGQIISRQLPVWVAKCIDCPQFFVLFKVSRAIIRIQSLNVCWTGVEHKKCIIDHYLVYVWVHMLRNLTWNVVIVCLFACTDRLSSWLHWELFILRAFFELCDRNITIDPSTLGSFVTKSAFDVCNMLMIQKRVYISAFVPNTVHDDDISICKGINQEAWELRLKLLLKPRWPFWDLKLGVWKAPECPVASFLQ